MPYKAKGRAVPKTAQNAWFEVDRKGLSQLMADRPRSFILAELIQNAWDQQVTRVSVEIKKLRRGLAVVTVVDDDPDGWADLTHAYTLYAPSAKKADPTLRGRFNIGEKLVLSVAREARIVTVTGGVAFDAKGRHNLRSRRESGSLFEATLSMTDVDIQEFEDFFHTLIAPPDIETTLKVQDRTVTLNSRTPVSTLELSLPTVIADDDGNLKRSRRATTVELYEPTADEVPHIYELGIPVVETEDRWHVNVQQKVPLNADRDNVTPAYLAELRVAVLNEAAHLLDTEDFSESWVTEASSDERCTDAVTERVMTARFGEKRVAYDPSNPEANRVAAANGHTVITGGTLTGGQWRNAKAASAITAAGQKFPTSYEAYSNNPNAPEAETVDPADWTADQRDTVEFSKRLHELLLGCSTGVVLVKTGNAFAAAYSRRSLHLNVDALGRQWFRRENRKVQVELMLHEFAHFHESDHLSENFADTVGSLGAKLAWHLGLEKI